jgi:hypothetical protein
MSAILISMSPLFGKVNGRSYHYTLKEMYQQMNDIVKVNKQWAGPKIFITCNVSITSSEG